MNKDKICILIAESNSEIAKALEAEARRRGWFFEVVESAEALLARLNETLYSEFSFDLIIADMCFGQPDCASSRNLSLDGLTALREIRKVFPNLPFVFFSSEMEALATTEALNLGATVCPNKDEILKHQDKIASFFDRVALIAHFQPLQSNDWNGAERRAKNVPALNRHRRAGDEKPLARSANAESGVREIKLPKPLIRLQNYLNARSN